MKEIIFKQTHNAFLDYGIAELYRYLLKAERPQRKDGLKPSDFLGRFQINQI